MTIDPFAPDADVEFPEFSEPEPPDDLFPSAPAASSTPTPISGGGGLTEIAARLGVNLQPDEISALKDAGESLNLCKDDALWILILLQFKSGAAFRAVPAEVETVLSKTREAVELQIKMATLEAANSASKAVKKDIFKALSEGERKTLKPLFFAAAGASFVSLAIGGIAGFWVGNFSSIQHPWVLNLAKIFGIGA